jgi:hypothetical protein
MWLTFTAWIIDLVEGTSKDIPIVDSTSLLTAMHTCHLSTYRTNLQYCISYYLKELSIFRCRDGWNAYLLEVQHGLFLRRLGLIYYMKTIRYLSHEPTLGAELAAKAWPNGTHDS